MSENVADCCATSFWWVTGIIFFLIDKRPFVRFHAAQSMVVFGGLHMLPIMIGAFFGAGYMPWASAPLVLSAAHGLINLLAFILWILLMVKAYQHEKFEVPIAAGIAKGFAGTSRTVGLQAEALEPSHFCLSLFILTFLPVPSIF